MSSQILLVEDEESIASFIMTALEREGFGVTHAESGETALSMIAEKRPDLLLLDIMLPGMDGLDVCRRVRALANYLPIIMLTAKGDEIDRVVGLELGADDYVSKPFSARELIARIRAVLRLAQEGGEAKASEGRILVDDRLAIDTNGRTTTIEGGAVDLTPKEFDLLALLAENRGKVLGRETLLERIWGFDYLGESRTVDVHIQRLRRKIEEDSQNPKYILTVRTVGYKFAEKAQH